MRNEKKNYITIALRLYLSGTSRKDAWSSKVCLVSVCLVSVSVSIGFGVEFDEIEGKGPEIECRLRWNGNGRICVEGAEWDSEL